MSQDTRTVEDIAGMVRDAEVVDEEENEELKRVFAEKKAQTVSSAGYRYLWDVETKEKVPILYYMLAQQLAKKTPDGRPRFVTKKPDGEPWRGIVRCLLHKDNPQREYFNSMGLRVCKKENIQSPHALTQHMRLKHPQEWKLIEDEKKEKERLEDREIQRAILSRVAPPDVPAIQPTTEAPLYVSDKPPKVKKKK